MQVSRWRASPHAGQLPITVNLKRLGYLKRTFIGAQKTKILHFQHGVQGHLGGLEAVTAKMNRVPLGHYTSVEGIITHFDDSQLPTSL
jgi:hypothetical protein